MRILYSFFLIGINMTACKTPHAPSNIPNVVTFAAGACFGTCPIFEMSIQQNGDAVLDARMYNALEGRYLTRIPPAYMDTLRLLIASGMSRGAKDSFSLHVTDQPTYNLAVSYQDGSTKKVYDYGGGGTEGLERIYNYLFDLRETQQWSKDTTWTP